MTVKPLYGHQQGAVKGYNLHKPGRPSHTYHTYFITNLRVVLDVEVQAGNQTASKYSSPRLWELLGRLPRAHWPVAIRGDRDWGTQANMARAEQEDLPYLFKLRMTKGVKKTVERLMGGTAMDRGRPGLAGCRDPHCACRAGAAHAAPSCCEGRSKPTWPWSMRATRTNCV